jgi:hypothetical protein
LPAIAGAEPLVELRAEQLTCGNAERQDRDATADVWAGVRFVVNDDLGRAARQNARG